MMLANKRVATLNHRTIDRGYRLVADQQRVELSAIADYLRKSSSLRRQMIKTV